MTGPAVDDVSGDDHHHDEDGRKDQNFVVEPDRDEDGGVNEDSLESVIFAREALLEFQKGRSF